MATPSLILGNGNWAVKSDSLLGYALPQGKYVPREFTVTRATTATRTNPQGLVEVVPYNLVSWSEMFSDASWIKSATVTISANTQIAPNGTLTADTITCNGTGLLFTRQQIYNATTLTCSHSIYAKKGNTSYFAFRNSGGPIHDVFNFDTKSWTQNSTATLTYEELPNGWFRLSSINTDAIGNFFISFFPAENTSGIENSTVNNKFVYVWGAQGELSSTLKTYLPTTTRLNIARVDYSLGSANLLLEPQRTNLALRSEEFDNASWTKAGSAISANSTISPSGVQNADTITGDGTNTTHYVTQGITSVIGTSYTLSVYAKKNTNNFIQIFGLSSGFGVTTFANFDINNGVLGTIGSTATATITNVGNGWYRCTMTATAVGITNGMFVELISSATSPRAEVNTLSTSFFLWGAQLEAGAYATSYIPTTTASVTRNADQILLGNVYTNGLISASGGTWFVELRGNVPRIRDLSSQFWLGDTASTALVNAFTFRGQTSSSRLTISKVVAATTTTIFTTTTDTVKVAIKWNGSTADVFVNGVKVVTATAFTTTNMEFLNCFTADVPKYINQMALYTTPLTDPELISLTTL